MARKSALRKWLGLTALLGAPLLTAAAAQAAIKKAPTLPTAPANGEMGFILTAFAPAIHQGKGDCPDGLAGTVKQNYLETLSAGERTRLLLKANEKELTQLWQAWVLGPDGNTNICSNPELFNRPLQKTIRGPVAYGLNLDGDATGKGGGISRPHENFTGVDGTPGVDNQAYRAMGCTLNYRGVDGQAGDIVKGFNMMLATGEHSAVILLRGVSNMEHDDEVEVIIATTGDRPILDSKMNFIRDASFAVSDNPRWRAVTKGRIDKGVLTTDPVDIHLTHKMGHGGVRGQRMEWDLRQARLRLAFQPDGSVKGLLGAYQPIRNVIESTILGGIGAATVAGMDCAAQYGTLKALADGPTDAMTGLPTISVGLTVEAVPAFVTDTLPSANARTVAAAQ